MPLAWLTLTTLFLCALAAQVNEAGVNPVFAIGDVQGCFDQFAKLLNQVEKAAGQDVEIWLVGDLVNRGPKSLEMLRWCVKNNHRVKAVLGNHDLHLLALDAGIRSARADDTLAEVLTARDKEGLLTWLRRLPLAHYAQGHLMVHAGVLPQWSVQHTLELSREVSLALGSDDWRNYLCSMYGNEPSRWSPGLRGPDRARVIINALTRLRFCSDEGTMEFESKEGAGSAPEGYKPWFEVKGRMASDTPIVFGHWSTLGLTNQPHVLGIDTGCVWGGKLTAVRLNLDPNKRKFIQVARA
jgi:bis(5'-nucleosyl)-tetraphosphatase (symmetrical)